jgi:hypothetical protein
VLSAVLFCESVSEGGLNHSVGKYALIRLRKPLRSSLDCPLVAGATAGSVVTVAKGMESLSPSPRRAVYIVSSWELINRR